MDGLRRPGAVKQRGKTAGLPREDKGARGSRQAVRVPWASNGLTLYHLIKSIDFHCLLRQMI